MRHIHWMRCYRRGVVFGGLLLLMIGLSLSGPHPAAAGPAPDAAPTPDPAGPSFPRLGMWWPDLEKQALEDVARYDFVILSPDQESYLDQLKELHPEILLLTSTNACELSYIPGDEQDEYDKALNDAVRAVPAEWFLTQQGSTLTRTVDDKTTLLEVAEVTREEDGKTIELFVPGDSVLLEGESLLVEKVDQARRRLTVQRGYVRPAAAHRAGTRLAAHVSFWPQSWLMNLSTLSPWARAADSPTAETWAEYNARVAVKLMEDPRWDGILLDRSDANESWLIGNSTARSLDPDQSNHPLEDLATFDAAWNVGLRNYESLIRTALGKEKIIYTNWGMPNYDLLNGNNFEGFPDEQGSYGDTSWQEMVSGSPEGGSYFNWMAGARQPNLSMIETYEDDGGPDATGSGEYENPARKAGFRPNYRKMRFGLATALLHDGYFSYEVNTNGHGSLDLFWFDEYDNAGKKRGYLGQPLGAAVRLADSLTGQNLLPGGGMDLPADLEDWNLWVDEETECRASMKLDEDEPAAGQGAVRIDVAGTPAGSPADGSCENWQVSFSSGPLKIEKGVDYTLSFRARTNGKGQISAWAQQAEDPWETDVDFGSVRPTSNWQEFSLSGKAGRGDRTAEFHFGLGEVSGTVWLDELRLQEGSREIWRRDFSGGIVLLNATSSSQKIPLNGTFQKITGTQAPEINDGRRVREVILPPVDGIILLR